jgi:uncharacterized protein YndB with AHSA1/START domain
MMATTAQEQGIHTLEIQKETHVNAPIDVTFKAVLDELGPGSELPDGAPFPMRIEPRPGGRWYRDLGGDAGHLWGHVQVIKPPGLLELRGPLFMSYPSENFVQYRLTADGGGTRLVLTHRAFGMIPLEDRENVGRGWAHAVERIRRIAEQRA